MITSRPEEPGWDSTTEHPRGLTSIIVPRSSDLDLCDVRRDLDCFRLPVEFDGTFSGHCFSVRRTLGKVLEGLRRGSETSRSATVSGSFIAVRDFALTSLGFRTPDRKERGRDWDLVNGR